MSRNRITFESVNGTIKVVEDDMNVTVEFGSFKVEYDATSEDVTISERHPELGWLARCGSGPRRDPHRTFRLPDGSRGEFASEEELRRRGLR